MGRPASKKPSSAPTPARLLAVALKHPQAAVFGTMAVAALLHYLSPQTGLLPYPAGTFLTRHTVERFLFVLPMALATLAFGRKGGLAVLWFSLILMVPRALWLSPSPPDALLETGAAALIGYCVVTIIYGQARERAVREAAVARLHAVLTLARTVAEPDELDQVLGRALDRLLEVMGLEVGLIALVDPQSRELSLRVQRGLELEGESGPAARTLAPDLWRRIEGSGEPVLWDGPFPGFPSMERSPRRTKLVVPLRSKRSVPAVLALGGDEGRTPKPDDLELLSGVAEALGISIENEQLHEELARQLLVQRQLNEVAQRIVSELEVDRIMPTVLQIAQELTGADAGEIVLCDSGGASEHYCCTPNLPERRGGSPTEELVHYRALRTRQPVLVEDYPQAPGRKPAVVRLGVAGIAAVPILSGERCFGTLCLFNLDRTKRFNASDMAMLSGVGRQTGIAMENARLYQSMRFYVRQITRAQEDERKRIARELHDETIQLMVAITRGLESFSAMTGELAQAAQNRLASLQDLLRKAAKGMRRFVQDLRPPMLDHLGLVACLEGLAADLEEQSGLRVSVKVAGKPRRLPPEHELVLFRIAQEAVTNARRHARATKALIFLEFLAQLVRVTVSDDGRGFSAPERIEDLLSDGKLGLVGMHERARTVGGTLVVRSGVGEGAAVIAEVPSASEPTPLSPPDRTGGTVPLRP